MIASRLVLLSLVIACGSAPPSSKIAARSTTPHVWTEETFERGVQLELERHFPGAIVRMTEEIGFSVTPRPPASAFVVRFHKPREACRADWSTCQTEVDHVLATIDQALGAAPNRTYDPSQLRIALRSSAKLAAATAELTVRPFSDEAQWVLVADLPTSVHLSVSREHHGMSDDIAWQTALENSRPATFATTTADDILVLQDDYAPSALLFPAALEAAARAHRPGRKGNLLVVCPEENIVLYTIGGAVDAANLAKVARGGSTDSLIPLSNLVMQWTGDAWRAVP